MNQKSFCLVSGILFFAIAALHLLRIVFGWETVVSGWVVPKWPSWLALFVAGYLAYEGLRLGKKS